MEEEAATKVDSKRSKLGSKNTRPAILIQPALPAYRRHFVSKLNECSPKLRILSGTSRANETVKIGVAGMAGVETISNQYLFGRRLLWHRCTSELLAAPAVVLDLNPRNLSTWVSLVARRVLRRPTIVWGHGRSRSHRESVVPKAARQLQIRLANKTIVYTDSEAVELGLAGHRGVEGAGNGLYPTDQLSDPVWSEDHANSFVYSGRLVVEKEVDLILEALALASEDRLNSGRSLLFLHVIGDGPDRTRLGDVASQLGIAKQVVWHGAIWDDRELARIYSQTISAVSGGYIGLNAIQAYAHGRPIIWRERCDVAHAPELEAIRNDRTTMVPALNIDQVGGFAAIMTSVANDSPWIYRSSKERIELIREHYNSDRMANVIANAINTVTDHV